jgi:hypothetical protein
VLDCVLMRPLCVVSSELKVKHGNSWGIALGSELCPFVECLNGTNWSYEQFSVNINFDNWCYHGVDNLITFVRTCCSTRLPFVVAGFSFCLLFATGLFFFQNPVVFKEFISS